MIGKEYEVRIEVLGDMNKVYLSLLIRRSEAVNLGDILKALVPLTSELMVTPVPLTIAVHTAPLSRG